METTVEMIGVTKRFGNVVANDKVNFCCKVGHIHGLIGENGAGKTTLMKILYGMHQLDEGEILIRGEKVRLNSPKAAIRQGIGMVHQHFTLVPSLTVAQNIILGRPPLKKSGTIDIKEAIAEVERMSRDYNLTVDPKSVVDDLPVGVRQRVEILKAL